MKISKDTMSLLKNYAAINSNLLLKPGNKLATVSVNKTVAATSTVSESFPVEFGIYDLNAFLSAISMFDEPELTFADKFVTIAQDNSKIKYYAADTTVLSYPSKDIQFPEAQIEFKLTSANMSSIQRTAGCLKASDVTIEGNGSEITLIVGDKKNPTGNTYETIVGSTDLTFKANIKIENLKMINDDFNVSISNKRISRFASVSSDLVYFVAVEADSQF